MFVAFQSVFKSGVFLVQLDVSVLDKDRQPVRGLTAADFTVLEDGKSQKIAAFAAVDVPSPKPPAAAWMRSIAPDVRTNDEVNSPEGRLFVILLDDALIPFDPAAIKSAKDVARTVIDRLSPADRVAVVFSAGSTGSQNFTNDRARLLAAIDTLNPTYAMHTLGWDTAPPHATSGGRGALPAVPMGDPDIPYRLASMTTLRMVAETLVAAPERRKLLLFVSPGISVDTASASTPTRAGGLSMAMKRANEDLFHAMQDSFRQMQVANVTIYPIDPCGFGGLEAYALGVAQRLPSLRGASLPPPPFYDWLAPSGPPPPDFLARHISTVSMDFLLAAASNTGGKAIVNTNDFEPGVNQIFAENSSYYLIGYAAPERNQPGSLHRLNVRVNRPGVTVRTRSGYAMPEAERAEKSAPPPTAAMKSIAGPVARGDLPLRVALSPVAGPEGPVVTIVLGLNLPAVTARTSQMFELRTGAYTPDGRARASQRHTATVTLVPTADGEGGRFELLSKFALPPGRYELRLGAQRLPNDAWGSVYADVEVPDFAKAPLSLSGVMIETSPATAAAPRGELASLVPILPTARREFVATDRAAGFLRVYQGGAGAVLPVTIAVRLVNARDERVVEATDTLPSDRFGDTSRAAYYRFVIPTSTLAPGEYLLTFDVTAGGATATRAVRFTMR